ncbi:hypothetical protein [Aquimarina sp. AU474]|uniref:dioxygenase family protein n=1 Tax=Aquimarina sp. AU474 TaxID=2108529 RepID=UPI000D68C206|nr:hypothetical protein [Aquimarina sp. AU474]
MRNDLATHKPTIVSHHLVNQNNQRISNSNSPEVVNLNTKNLPGIPTMISGKIYNKNNQPISGAHIEIWHADDAGAYHTDGNFYFPSQSTLSGYSITNTQGEYKVKTIRPGVYGYRARHFHYRISAKGYTTLETQIYFKDDPRIQIDEIALIAEESRHIQFRYHSTGYLEGIANIFLPKM